MSPSRPPLWSRVSVAMAAGETRLGTVVARSTDTLLRPWCTVALDGGGALTLLDDHLAVITARPPLRLAAVDGEPVP